MSTVCQLRPQCGVRGDESFYNFSINSVLMLMILQLYFIIYSRRNKSKRHVLCLFTNITVDMVPWQRGFYEKLRGSCLLLSVEFSRYLAQQKSKRHASGQILNKLRTNVDIFKYKIIKKKPFVHRRHLNGRGHNCQQRNSLLTDEFSLTVKSG